MACLRVPTVTQMVADAQAQPRSTAPRRARTTFRGSFARWPRTTGAALAVVTFLATVFLTEDPDQDLSVRALTDVPLPAFGVFAVASGALRWRRKRPLEVLAVTLDWCCPTDRATDKLGYRPRKDRRGHPRGPHRTHG